MSFGGGGKSESTSTQTTTNTTTNTTTSNTSIGEIGFTGNDAIALADTVGRTLATLSAQNSKSFDNQVAQQAKAFDRLTGATETLLQTQAQVERDALTTAAALSNKTTPQYQTVAPLSQQADAGVAGTRTWIYVAAGVGGVIVLLMFFRRGR